MIKLDYQNIYEKSPYFFQSYLVSIYGIYIYFQRYAGAHASFYKFLSRSQWFSKDEIEEYQFKQFKKLIIHALDTVPFYDKFKRKSKFTASDFNSLRDVLKLPIINRLQISRNPMDFCSKKMIFSKYKTFWLHTSGTTGTPTNILCDYSSRQKHYAFWTRLRSWNGLKHRARRATFFSRSVVNINRKKPPFWNYDLIGNNLVFSLYHLSNKNVCYYCEKLLYYQPDEIIGYPSALNFIARYILDNNISGIHPKCIFTTAETLKDFQRKSIENAFKTKVVDQYGCTEMALFASQCPHSTFHIHPEHGFVEVINGNEEQVSSSEPGNAVCTSFINYAMPLIRYELGDTLSTHEYDCACGRHFPIIDNIIGRIDDVVITPDGRELGRVSSIFKEIDGLIETQIIQNDISSLDIYLVCQEEMKKNIYDNIKFSFENKLGINLTLKFHFVKEIKASQSGKKRLVISKVIENKK